MLADLKHALRSLGTTPGFFVIATAIVDQPGIGASTRDILQLVLRESAGRVDPAVALRSE